MQRKKDWWKAANVYQIYPKSFCDSNGDGFGDLKGIISKLDYLQLLGVDVLWLCPIYCSPMRDNGYDISDYYNIDPRFGTMADLDELIAEAKRHGMQIVMDLVINHCSDQNHWFQEALRDKNSPYRDYFIFREGKDGKAPCNWRSIFGGSVWEPTGDGAYYFHTFAKEQPDLNWESETLREELYRMVNFWLDKGLGGFRVDAITYIKKNPAFPDFAVDGADGLAGLNPGCQNYPGIEVFLGELAARTFHQHGCMTVAEAPGVPEAGMEDFVGENGFFSMIFTFDHADMDVLDGVWCRPSGWTVHDFRQGLFDSQLASQRVGWAANYLENHDQPRSLNKYLPAEIRNAAGAKFLATLYYLLRGTPYIYQGEELGLVNCPFESVEEFDDLSSVDQYARGLEEGLSESEALRLVNARSRDNSRIPFPWDGTEKAGFTTGTPWIKFHPAGKQINAQTQISNSDSVFSYYRQLIQLRNHSVYSDALIYGDFRPICTEVENLLAYTREYEEQKVLVFCNMQAAFCTVPLYQPAKLLLSNGNVELEQDVLTLHPYQAVVLGGQ